MAELLRRSIQHKDAPAPTRVAAGPSSRTFLGVAVHGGRRVRSERDEGSSAGSRTLLGRGGRVRDGRRGDRRPRRAGAPGPGTPPPMWAATSWAGPAPFRDRRSAARRVCHAPRTPAAAAAAAGAREASANTSPRHTPRRRPSRGPGARGTRPGRGWRCPGEAADPACRPPRSLRRLVAGGGVAPPRIPAAGKTSRATSRMAPIQQKEPGLPDRPVIAAETCRRPPPSACQVRSRALQTSTPAVWEFRELSTPLAARLGIGWDRGRRDLPSFLSPGRATQDDAAQRHRAEAHQVHDH